MNTLCFRLETNVSVKHGVRFLSLFEQIIEVLSPIQEQQLDSRGNKQTYNNTPDQSRHGVRGRGS